MPSNTATRRSTIAPETSATLVNTGQCRVIVVLPAYNEGPNLRPLLSSMHEAMEAAGLSYEVVVVDDGSADDTRDVLHEAHLQYPVTIVQHHKNCGLSQTIRDGLLEATRRASATDVIVTMDADGTHPPAQIRNMIKLIQGGCDVVVASRFRPGAKVCGVPLFRQVLSIGASCLCCLMFPTRGIRDYTCGYRAFRSGVLLEATRVYGQRLFDAEGFSCTMDLLLKLRRMNIVFAETPIILRYDLKGGQSKMRVWSTIVTSLKLLLRHKLNF